MQKRKNTKKVSKKSVRLDKSVVPVEYDIQLRPDLENFTFEGLETITIFLQKPTKKLTLHSKEIEIETAHIILNKEKVFSKISYNEKTETATFTFPKVLPKGKQKLTLVFKGILNDKMRGFYRSSYVYDGKVHHMATSQLESTDARRAFPCFDEPAHKAVFHVSLVVPKGKTAISNTLPVTRAVHEAGYEVIRFAPTPKMSTYLLAFIVGDFDYIEKKSKRGVMVRVYTTPGKKHQADFALDTTVKVLDFYEEYFDIPYPLNTLDMIAIPDFTVYAMENWGAVTFREIALLVDDKHTSTAARELVAEVIAHELAHQWFGNLVTMEWWTHLWLNEGFASYIPYVVMDELFPEWNIWERVVTGKHGNGIALRLDGLKNTHPIEVEVHHPDEIGEIFDAISYSKGSSVIHMLASYIGAEAFRDGLRYYLKRHSYKNTETVHLWEAFEKVTKKPVRKMMGVWTSKEGYPVVNASKDKKGSLVLEQTRFFSSALSKKRSKDKTVWPVPVSVYTPDGTDSILMQKKKTVLPVSGAWLKLNKEETGFFRSAYSHELLMALKEPVVKKELSSVDRVGIIRDLFALSEAGVVPTTYVLEFLEAYAAEDNYIVWSEIASGLSALSQLVAKTKTEVELNKFILKLFTPQMERLGYDKKDTDAYTDTMLRSLFFTKLGRAGHKGVIKKAREMMEDIQKGKHIEPDMRGAVYTIIAHNGARKDYRIFIEMYKKETLQEEKNSIGSALADFRDQRILEDVAKFTLSKYVRSQDCPSMLIYIGINPMGRDVWWNFFKTNWEELKSRYGEGGFTLSRIIGAIARSPEKKHFTMYKKFFKTHYAPGAARAVEQAVERMESSIDWLARDGKKIDKFLKDN